MTDFINELNGAGTEEHFESQREPLPLEIWVYQNPINGSWNVHGPGVWLKSKAAGKFNHYIDYSEHHKVLKELEKLKQDYVCATL